MSRAHAFKFDLLDLPGLRWWKRLWRDLTVANLAVRREAKSLLFHELAVAAEQGVPIEEALRLCGQTWRENAAELDIGKRFGADTRGGWWKNLYVLLGAIGSFAALFASFWLFFLLFLMAPAMADHDRVARLMALRLERKLRSGLPLSVAMAQYGLDYSVSEIALVEAAESSGRLPAGLRRLADYQITNHRHIAVSGFLTYPFVLACVGFGIVAFLFVRLMPKWEDIFWQLGAELPPLTQSLIQLSHSHLVSVLLTVVLTVGGHYLLLRFLMNGNALMRALLVPFTLVIQFAMVSCITGSLLALVLVVNEFLPFVSNEELAGYITMGVSGIIVLLFCPLFMRWIESAVVWIERYITGAVSFLPFIRSAARAEQESRWLAALSLMLESGVPEADALRYAGQIAGFRFRRRSESAVAMVEQGHSLSEAVQRGGILPGRLAARTAFALHGENLPLRLKEVSDEQSMRAVEYGARVARIVEIVGIVLVGTVFSLIVLSLYLPLFSIPGIVGHDQ